MGMKLFKDTKTMNAMFYLTSDGDETARDDVLREMRDGYPIYMVYLGGGYVPLTLAVEAFVHEGEAWEAVQEWARKADRLDEIGEDVECPHCEIDKVLSSGEHYKGQLQMYWRSKIGSGPSIWQCPSCDWTCEEPAGYGEVELVIQEVPKSVLETAWVLARPFQGERVGIWKATVQRLDKEEPLVWVTMDQLEPIISYDHLLDLNSVYEVVTDNLAIKELIQ